MHLSKRSQKVYDRLKNEFDITDPGDLNFLKHMMEVHDEYLAYWDRQKEFEKDYGPLISQASIEEGEMYDKKMLDLANQFNSLIADRDWDTKEWAKIMKELL